MEQDDKLVFYELGDNIKPQDVIRSIDNMLTTHRVWRLVVFQEADKMEIIDCSLSSVENTLQDLLWYYTKSVRGTISQRCKYYPEEVWYVGWMEKQDIVGINDLVFNRLGDPSVCNLQVFGVPVNIDSRMEQRYSEFMICCILLILAINQFPIGFLSSRYLYFVQIEYDRKRFVKYVNTQYEIIQEIERELDAEKQKLQKQRTEGVLCPKYVPVVRDKTKRNKMPDIKEMKKRIRWGNSEADTERALNQNAFEIRGWMHYPRGVMSGVVDRLSDKLDEEDMAEGFLSIEGRDRLKRETRSALEKISIQRKESVDIVAFEYGLRKREEGIKKEAEKRDKGNSSRGWKICPYALLGGIEAAFGIGIFFLVFADRMSEEIIEKIVIMVILGIVIFWGTVIGLGFSDRFFYWYAKKRYIRFLEKEMKGNTKKMDQYLDKMLEHIAEYQYYIRLNREQRQIERQWEQYNKRLEQHMYICHQSEDITQQLQYLLDEEDGLGLAGSMSSPGIRLEIDFMEEPQEVAYYWFPHKSNQSGAELNHSGYKMETMFNFIVRFKCVNDYRQIMLEDW